jgi:hypothetical protein
MRSSLAVPYTGGGEEQAASFTVVADDRAGLARSHETG